MQVRRKGKYASQSFRLKEDADAWATTQEDRAFRGETVSSARPAKTGTLGNLIRLHLKDHTEASKPIGRTKLYCLEKMERDIGHLRVADLTKQRLIEYGKQRSAEGAGPATVTVDLAHLRTVLDTATCVHDVETDLDALRHARMALTKLGYVAKSEERDRRPTQAEIDQLIEHFRTKNRQIIPLHRIIPFAVGSSMRQEEITKIDLRDLEAEKRIIKIWSRKDPRKKASNHQRVPLVALTGYDPLAIIQEQTTATGGVGRIFPYNPRSVGTAFREACKELGIEDLHFHDLRHEGISRLFEAGLDIPDVAQISGHRDWKQLRRYLHLRPEKVVEKSAAIMARTGVTAP